MGEAGEDEAVGKGSAPESWPLSHVLLGVAVLVFAVTSLLYWTDVPGLKEACERPATAYGQDACVPDSEREGGAAQEFVRVVPPAAERYAWWAATGVLLAVALGALVLASHWWSTDLRQHWKPERSALNVTVPAIFVVAQLALGGLAVSARPDAVSAWTIVVVGLSWIAAVPGFAGLLDVHSMATSGYRKRRAGQESVRQIGTDQITGLRSLADRFVTVLGIQVAAFVVWFGLRLQLRAAMQQAEVARQGGEYASVPNITMPVLVQGALLTGLLAIAWVAVTKALDRKGGPDETSNNRKRFEKQVAIAAPLLGAIFSQFLG